MKEGNLWSVVLWRIIGNPHKFVPKGKCDPAPRNGIVGVTLQFVTQESPIANQFLLSFTFAESQFSHVMPIVHFICHFLLVTAY